MKKRWIDRQQDFIMFLLRPMVMLWMRMDAKRKVFKGEGVDFRTHQPYIMLANHTFVFDVIHVPLRLRKVPFIVANQTLFKKNSTKFLVTQVAHVISKSKGQSDSSTVRDLIGAIKRGYPILIFPEGDTTFYGETGYIEPSTMKLIKKLEIDLITCNVRGGYLSKPRWALFKRKNRKIELHYERTLTAEQIKNMTVEEIEEVVKKALYYNAYDDQRTKMIKHPGKNLAHGLENVIYVCPHCQAINTIETEGGQIRCKSCQHEGHMDDYGFIHGFVYDNLVDWNNYQKQFSEPLKQARLETSGNLSFFTEKVTDIHEIGPIGLVYQKGELIISGSHQETIPLSEISNPTITMRRDLSFIHEGQYYLIRLDHSGAAFLRVMQDKY
jgi:1-acyl-sn-glycerol-3-phosphate acyltransferase